MVDAAYVIGFYPKILYNTSLASIFIFRRAFPMSIDFESHFKLCALKSNFLFRKRGVTSHPV